MIVSAKGTNGLGATLTGNQIVGTVGGTAATLAGGIFSSTALMTALGIAPAFGPVGLAIAGVVAAGAAIASALGVGGGCGPDCIAATKIVNQAEPLFKANLDAYENGQIPQNIAIQNYQQMWAAVVQGCNAVPGQVNCVGDRQAGSCKWKATSQPYPSSPSVGSCWNWDSGYYQPLLSPPVNAPVVDEGNVSDLISNITGGGSSSNLMVIVGIGIVGMIMIGSKN